MTHKQKMYIAGCCRKAAYEWIDSYTRRQVLHEKRKKGHTRADSRVFDQTPELVPLDPVFNLIFTHYNPVSCVPNLVFHFPF